MEKEKKKKELQAGPIEKWEPQIHVNVFKQLDFAVMKINDHRMLQEQPDSSRYRCTVGSW